MIVPTIQKKQGVVTYVRGFTLIEIVIVLVLLGVLIGLGAVLLSPLTKQSRHRKSVEIVHSAKETVTRFVLKNRRLPNGAEFAAITKNVDAWGGTLLYAPVTELTEADICCINVDGFTVNDEKNTDKTGIAFVILSEGKDRADSTTERAPSPEYNIRSHGNDYDDIIEYVSISELRNKVVCTDPEIVSMSLPDGTEDRGYSAHFEARRACPPYSNWRIIRGSLPKGLSMDADTGAITGKINTSRTAFGSLKGTCPPKPKKTAAFTVQVDDALHNSAAHNFTMNVFSQKLRIKSSKLQGGTVGHKYNAEFLGRGGNARYSWSISSGSLPDGLALDVANGEISGIPTSEGEYHFTVSLNDTCNTTSKEFVISVTSTATSLLSCSITAKANQLIKGQSTDLTWSVINGPADGTWTPEPGGTCAAFSSSSSGRCTSDILGTTTTFTLSVKNLKSTSSCQTTVQVSSGCQKYTILNSAMDTLFYRLKTSTGCEEPLAPGSSVTIGTEDVITFFVDHNECNRNNATGGCSRTHAGLKALDTNANGCITATSFCAFTDK